MKIYYMFVDMCTVKKYFNGEIYKLNYIFAILK